MQKIFVDVELSCGEINEWIYERLVYNSVTSPEVKELCQWQQPDTCKREDSRVQGATNCSSFAVISIPSLAKPHFFSFCEMKIIATLGTCEVLSEKRFAVCKHKSTCQTFRSYSIQLKFKIPDYNFCDSCHYTMLVKCVHLQIKRRK